MKKKSNPPPPEGVQKPLPPAPPPRKHPRTICIDGVNSDARDAERYRWIKKNFEWRRIGTLTDNDSHAFVGCRFPYLANFGCVAMLDYNIDKMIEKDR